MIVDKIWFFIVTKTATNRGTRFRNGDRPNQETMQNLVDTVITKNVEDKAKESSSEDVKTLSGHVVASTSAQAIAFQTALSDRTLSVQPHQLPETVKGSDTAITLTDTTYGTSYINPILDIANASPTVRNTYTHKITAGFSNWLAGILSNISVALKNNITQTNTNTSNIAANTAAIDALSGGTFSGSVPIGSMSDFGGIADPNANFLICDGRSLVRTSYPALFAVISNRFGEGVTPGSTFALPNFNGGKTSKGLDSTITAYNTVGKTGGLNGKMLTIYDLPAHKHPARNDFSNGADINIFGLPGLPDDPADFGAHTHKSAFAVVGYQPNNSGSGGDNIGDGGDINWKNTTTNTLITTNGGLHKHGNASFAGSVGYQYNPSTNPQTALDLNSPFVIVNKIIRVL